MANGASRNGKLARVGVPLATVISVLLLLYSVFQLFYYQVVVSSAIAAETDKYRYSMAESIAKLNKIDPKDKEASSRRYELESLLSFETQQYNVLVAGQLVSAGLGLNSCGLSLGMAFTFLGLALFLYEIPGEIDAGVEADKWKIRLARLSPGGLCLVCATVIIIFSLTNRPRLEISPQKTTANVNVPV